VTAARGVTEVGREGATLGVGVGVGEVSALAAIAIPPTSTVRLPIAANRRTWELLIFKVMLLRRLMTENRVIPRGVRLLGFN